MSLKMQESPLRQKCFLPSLSPHLLKRTKAKANTNSKSKVHSFKFYPFFSDISMVYCNKTPSPSRIISSKRVDSILYSTHEKPTTLLKKSQKNPLNYLNSSKIRSKSPISLNYDIKKIALLAAKRFATPLKPSNPDPFLDIGCQIDFE